MSLHVPLAIPREAFNDIPVHSLLTSGTSGVILGDGGGRHPLFFSALIRR